MPNKLPEFKVVVSGKKEVGGKVKIKLPDPKVSGPKK